MIGWLWRMLVGRFSRCDHKWKTVREGKLILRAGAIPYGSYKECRCEKCGAWRQFEL